MTRRQQREGKAGQNVAAVMLTAIGIERVRQIGTPVRLVDSTITSKGIYFKVVWGEQVAGDHTGIAPGGIFVLAETKTHDGTTLPWSVFRDHQPGELSDHALCGGISLVVWVCGQDIFILRWPVPGFGPGKSIPIDYARQANITTVRDL